MIGQCLQEIMFENMLYASPISPHFAYIEIREFPRIKSNSYNVFIIMQWKNRICGT
jgi:hypothetical protein